jgi:hypothetical protein
MIGFNLYCVFLLRLWQEADGTTSEPAPLRIVLEEPHSGQRRAFASLPALLAYLEETVERPKINDVTGVIRET